MHAPCPCAPIPDTTNVRANDENGSMAYLIMQLMSAVNYNHHHTLNNTVQTRSKRSHQAMLGGPRLKLGAKQQCLGKQQCLWQATTPGLEQQQRRWKGIPQVSPANAAWHATQPHAQVIAGKGPATCPSYCRQGLHVPQMATPPENGNPSNERKRGHGCSTRCLASKAACCSS